MRRLRIMLILGLLAAFLLGGLWLLIPVTPGSDAESYSPLGTSLALIDLSIAVFGAVLFLRALRNFKPELKPAYRLIAYAQFVLGLLTLMYPYIEYYNSWGTLLVDMATYFPYFASSILLYLGIRKFSKIFNLRTRVTSLRLLIGVILFVWIAHAFLPHVEIFDAPEYIYDLFAIVPIIPAVLYGCAAYMAFKLRQRVGGEYKKAFTWLTIGLFLQWTTTALVFGSDIFGYDHWLFTSLAYYVMPVIASDIGLLLAAYHFNTIGLFDEKKRRAGQPPVTSIDIVLYAADMVSDVTRIDQYLDKMRSITSNLQPGQSLKPADQKVLKDVYLSIENHLISADPMRTFTRPALRETITRYFGLDPEDTGTFWATISDDTPTSHQKSQK